MLCLRSLVAPNLAISAAESAPALDAVWLRLLSLPPLLFTPPSASSAGWETASAVSCTHKQNLQATSAINLIEQCCQLRWIFIQSSTRIAYKPDSTCSIPRTVEDPCSTYSLALSSISQPELSQH